MARILKILIALSLLVCGQSAAAHLTPNSEISLRPVSDGYAVSIIVPAAEYTYASGNAADNRASSLEDAVGYLRDRFRATGQDGTPLAIDILDVKFAQVEGPEDLFAEATITQPPGSADSPFTLHWSVVNDRVPDHFALVFMDKDGSRQVQGSLRQVDQSLSIDPQGTPSAGFANAVWLGASHIIGGFDHLLFLLALLISAPLIAQKGRWVGIEPPRRAIWQVAKVATGFTLGHSITLVVAGLANWSLPVAPVEALIALSVVVTALHALRPIFPGREAWVATGFGLVHGLAFATLATGSTAMPSLNLTTLLGFNIGIELVQLAVLAAALPVLFHAMRDARFGKIRNAAGLFTAVCGSIWLMQRLSGALA